jgi:hypothetical protein
MPKTEWFKVKDKTPIPFEIVIVWDFISISPYLAAYDDDVDKWRYPGNIAFFFEMPLNSIWCYIPEIPAELKND